MGVVKLYFTNKSPFSIGSFTTTLDNTSSSALKADTKSLPESTIAAESQSQQTIVFTATASFSEPPTIRISYLAGALQAYTLRIPVLPHKYMEPSELTAEDFFKRWRQIGGGGLEAQSTFSIKNGRMDEKWTRKTVEGFRWRMLSGVDPNSQNIVGCAVYQVEGGKMGVLLRLEPNVEQKVCPIFAHRGAT